MKKLLIILCWLSWHANAQNVGACKRRFDTYLNFKGSLNGVVKFENEVIYLTPGGRKELAIYEEELPALAIFFENSSLKQQEQFIRKKGLKKLSKTELDSILLKTENNKYFLKQSDQLPLKGYRVALDPGHFATTLQEAAVEQKFLYFVPTGSAKDTVKIFESYLTFNTASILKAQLEEQGASVYLTRDKSDHTSFNCTFSDWVKLHKKRTLDSLQRIGAIAPQKYFTLMKSTDYNLFWDFFRDYDLANRAEKVNSFNPHVTVIIHYNVDEKNTGWKKHTKKNFSMAFIGGAFTADNLSRVEGKINFLRLLLTDQLNKSELLAQETVANFNKQLNIDIAKPGDASYLTSSCLLTSSPGVFCRNLALCRKINSPLVYGESLYQDNEKESALLMRSDLDYYGVKSNERLKQVAASYFDAVVSFLKRY